MVMMLGEFGMTGMLSGVQGLNAFILGIWMCSV